MPELPEVETVRRILEPYAKGKTIANVLVLREKNIVTGAEAFISSTLGRCIKQVDRHGKLLMIRLDDGQTICSHLRMEGKYFEGKVGDPIKKHDLLIYEFTDGTSLIYNDVRKFGTIGLYDADSLTKDSPLAKLGKEPFELTKEELFALLQKKKKVTIKEALLDQSIICGLGNIYDCETLFATRINPYTPAENITLEQCQSILEESIRILNEALEEGGSTIRSYHPKEGMNGNMQNRLYVYGHEGEPCPNCQKKIRREEIGGRGTYYCPACQNRFVFKRVLAVTGPIHSGKSTASKYISSKGYSYWNADDEVHAIYASKEGKELLHLIFGRKGYCKGKPNWDYLRSQMARFPEKKKALTDKLYPILKKHAEKFILDSMNDVVLEIPLLYGSGMEDLCHEVILVYADIEKQKQRLLEEGRDASSLIKINASYPLKYALKHADYVIENSSSLEELLHKLNKIIN